MIVFHEGLPGSGKSYEAMKERIVPALAKGREVVAYVEGLDFAKIAELAGLTLDKCRELLHAVTREQVRADWLSLCRDNALIVFDEAQNFWGNRRKFTEAETELVTEHRHRGMDIVLMGQDLRDVHATWRRRVEVKLCFLKLNGLGFAKGYSVTTYRHLGGDDFKRAGLTLRKYDPRFFGTYKSHVTDETNTEVYTDQRAQIWRHPLVRIGIPVALGLAFWGLSSAWKFFHPAAPKAPEPAAAASAPAQSRGFVATARPALPASAPEPLKPENRLPIERRMTELQTKGRIRLAGLISSKDHISGVVEWVQAGNVVIERLSLDTLRSLGVAVLVTEDVVQLAVGDFRELATSWPLEDLGRMSESRQASIRGPVPATAPGRQVSPEVLAMGRPSMSMDLPGPLTSDPDAGSLPRRVRKVAQ